MSNSNTSSETTLAVSSPEPAQWEEELKAKVQANKLAKTWLGISALTCAVILPAAAALLYICFAAKRLTLVLFNHPLETLIELIMVCSIPVISHWIIRALAREQIFFGRKHAFALGMAIGTSLLVSLITILAFFIGDSKLAEKLGTNFAQGFALISFLYLVCALFIIQLANKVRSTKEFASSRRQISRFTIGGALLSLVLLVGCETRPWSIRMAQRMALSGSTSERNEGLQKLRELHPEYELGLECADQRAAGLPGLFIPLKASSQQQLYFAVTGKPYAFKDGRSADLSSLPDDYLSKQVVGDKLTDLSLTRSQLSADIHPQSLSSTISWTFVLKNDSSNPQDARAELRIPAGSAVTGLSLWQEGIPLKARFATIDQSNETGISGGGNALVTDLGRGRYLLCCPGINGEEELKVAISMIVPLKPDGGQQASLLMPKFAATNFELNGEHQIKLRSTNHITCSTKGLKPEANSANRKILTGSIPSQDLHSTGITVQVTRTDSTNVLVAPDKIASLMEKTDFQKTEEEKTQHIIQPSFVIQSLKKVGALAPKRLVVVFDSSVSTGPYKNEIKTALAAIPQNISTSFIVASQDNPSLMEAESLEHGLKTLDTIKCSGGQDNLQAVVKASALAGDSEGGAVLWIHGPQPSLNRELYIIDPYVSKPSFYEISVDTGNTDTVEFFKNHSEIGPFTAIPRNTTIGKDLKQFFAKWTPDSAELNTCLEQGKNLPKNYTIANAQEEYELVRLRAQQQCLSLISNLQMDQAKRIALNYNLVTPVSLAMVSPIATNGTSINSADEITGINTAGTVRVNNLANLEALLNIIANLFELSGIIGGLALIANAFLRKGKSLELLGMNLKLGRKAGFALGLGLILTGMAFPGVLNWFLSSARDANLFT